jgi:lipoprotein-anchoring transpeptidase ErfK/SrfK
MKDSNQITDDVKAGEVLKIRNPYQTQTQFTTTDTRWNIEIILSQNKLMVYKNGEKYKTSTVATGKDSLTPKGNFKIITKISNPGYTPKNIPGGDPENPLGTRWLGLNVQGTTGRTYGIHGTSDPTSLGKYVSNGCIRLENSMIEELYNILPVGTTVVIK